MRKKRLIDWAKRLGVLIKVLNKNRKGEKIATNTQKQQNYCKMKDKCLKLLQCKGFNKKNTENSCKDLGGHDLKSKQKTSKKDMKYMKYLKIDQTSKVK